MKRPPRFTLLPGLQVDESSHPHVLGSRVQPTSSVSTSFYLFRVSTGKEKRALLKLDLPGEDKENPRSKHRIN
jgi:hypothetical protein